MPSRELINLELHVAHGCNLTCESCSHYSNHGHKGMCSLGDADRWMAGWNTRLAPEVFSLLGGEPSIHPELTDFVTLTRRHWPAAHIRIVTNGFFLHRHPELPRVLAQDGNAQLYLSIHHDDAAYMQKVEPIVALLKGWHAEHGIRVGVTESHKQWTRRYTGFGAAMAPFADAKPRSSWEHCPARYCPQLFEGKLWKCAPIAYLAMQDRKYGLSAQWAPYLGYAPLEAGCTEEQLQEFFGREEEHCCNMCPAQPQAFKLPVPLVRAVG